MSILKFDEGALLRALDPLRTELRGAFAAACAQRQIPNYIRFATRTKSGDVSALTNILVRLWNIIEGTRADRELRELLDVCMTLMPPSTGRADEAFAEDAVSSVAYAICAQLTGNSQEAVWSAQRAFDAVFNYVMASLNVGLHDRSIVDRVVAHALVQSELGRQHRDLAELCIAGTNNGKAVIAAVRSRAEREPMDLS